MLIDWFTVGAQALNFVILVALLKHFLYRPILDAIDARERKIAAELADADAKRAEAQRQRDEFQHRNQQFDRQRTALLSEATHEAGVERERLLENARREADALGVKRQEMLRAQAKAISESITERAQREVFGIARKVLADLAAETLEERICASFLGRLGTMDGKARNELRDFIKTATEPALVRSAFDLPSTQRAAIEKSLSTISASEMHVRFETLPGLVSGIELVANGRKIAWSIADYLSSLEKSVAGLLQATTDPGAGAAAGSGTQAKSG